MPADSLAHARAFAEQDHDISGTGEPWGRRLWLSLAVVLVVAFVIESYGITTWPMADDEVPSLVEMGRLHIGAEHFFSVPPSQIGRISKMTPVWNVFQQTALDLLPANELSYRVPSLICALLTSGLAFLLAARWRGLWFAVALAIVVHGSQLFVLLAQVDRFYSLPLLLLVAVFGVMWSPRGGIGMIVLTGLLTILTVLSHNVTVAVFVLTFFAACPAYWLGSVPKTLVIRSGVAAAISALLYFLYLRPLIAGWNSTGNPTQVLVSFTAIAGIPALALAIFAAWVSLLRWRERTPMAWWALMFAGSLCLFQITSANTTWSPRYFLFFLPAVWMLAADAMEFIARRAGGGWTGVGWYGCVIVLLLPNLVSHFVDGSRHDYRQAATTLVSRARPDDPILSDDAETISYYLPAPLRQHLEVRTRVTTYPPSQFFVVYRSNAWMPLPQIPGRQMELLAEIYRRRVDQFSHVLRVYRVAAEP